jgi:hypothetical protein
MADCICKGVEFAVCLRKAYRALLDFAFEPSTVSYKLLGRTLLIDQINAEQGAQD